MSDQTQPLTNDRPAEVDGLDAAVEAEINPEPTQPDAMNVDGANEAEPAARNGAEDPVPAPLEARIPAKKDTTLREFLGKMDDYAPIVSYALFPRQFSLLTICHRFQTQSPTITSLLPDFHHLLKQAHSWRACWRSRPRSSLLISLRMPTNTPESVLLILQVITPWEAWAQRLLV